MEIEYDLESIIEAADVQLSNLKPSEWAETNRVMTPDTPMPGPLSYYNSPYTKEIINCLSPDHPARIVAVMKGSQIGFSATVIESGIGFIISQQPGNILFLIGHENLVTDAMLKIDVMLDNSGLRKFIRSSSKRSRSKKTGDTDKLKEFPNGYLKVGTANHKELRNITMRYGFIDDFEAMRGATKQSGSTAGMIEQRFSAFDKKMKLFYISTPELKHTSNILPAYLQGDQRKYHIPCPRCKELITLEWSTDLIGKPKEKAGITYKLDDNSKLVIDSVGYICQKCGGFFDDRRKMELINSGKWIPTAEPSRLGYYSYHINSLYAPTFCFTWTHYVQKFLAANPPGGSRIESLNKIFQNQCLGEPYEEKTEVPNANQLQTNIRNYEIGMIPEKLSIADGNGPIILLTCAADMNGLIDDARLDYEIVAWSESGASYSITHGSVGTFIPREGQKKFREDREKWTYENKSGKAIWPEFEKIISQQFKKDTGGTLPVFITGLDTGGYGSYYIHAYSFLDRTNYNVVGLKGKDIDKYIRYGIDLPSFKPAKERSKLFLVEVNQIKDQLADRMRLKWDSGNDDQQPPGFMNYPTPSKGLYLLNNYFVHFAAEERRIQTKEGESVAACWVKKSTIVQNHFWDCAVYNMVLKEIFTDMVCKEFKIPGKPTWKDYATIIAASKK